MRSSATTLAMHMPRTFARDSRTIAALLVLACALSGCAGTLVDTDTISKLPPLRLGDTTVTVADADRIPRLDLLAMDQPMRDFVARYTRDQTNTHIRLMSLHEAVRGAGGLDVNYDPSSEGTARDVFYSRTANCLSYANLFIALAREAGLDAHYQWVEVRPQWSRVSERVQLGLHVNVVVRLKGGKRYMVDIDPLPSRDISGSQELTDSEGEALHYNNIAIAALGNDEAESAWLYMVRALQLSPENAHLWANLGAIYRSVGQHREAEQSYLQALDLDFNERSAMTNLAVLYGLEGREEDRQYWMQRVEVHQRLNPYYHAWLGDEAGDEEDWTSALAHYDRAIELAPHDSHLWFVRGILYYHIDDYAAAAVNIEEAITLATLRSDIARFQRQLDEVRNSQLAALH